MDTSSRQTGVLYAREIGTPTNLPYPQKFKKLYDAVAMAHRSGAVLIIALPEALGDTYEEIVQSLKVIASADVPLRIVPPQDRRKDKDRELR